MTLETHDGGTVEVQNHGTIAMIYPDSDAARAWVEENVDVPSWGWLGDGFACEPRYVGDMLQGMHDAGLFKEFPIEAGE